MLKNMLLITAMIAVALLIGGRNHRDAPASTHHSISTVAEANSLGKGVITEDDPRWDCKTMGNRLCGIVSTPGPAALMFPGEKGNPLQVFDCVTAMQFGSELDIDYYC